MVSITDSSKQKARILAGAYGHKLERPVVYPQGVALTARLQLAELDNGYPSRTCFSLARCCSEPLN